MLRLQNISKIYPDFSLKNIHFEVRKGEYFVLLGKSGSGKSMLLEIIAGIKKQDSGQIILKDSDISHKKIQKRGCVLVYQDSALFPHMSVYDNLLFTLKNHKFKMSDACERIAEMAGFVSIEHIMNRTPVNLSGGEIQRVALGRALVVRPEILLLDEPLSSLDVQMRGDLQSLLHKINQTGQTIIHVTHDFTEAVSLSDRVAVIENGEIIQQGFTEEVFQNPRNEFVADLSGVKNFFKVTLHSDSDYDDICMAKPFNKNIQFRVMADHNHHEGYLTFSSSDVILSDLKPESSAANNFQGKVTDVVPHGLGIEVIVDIGVHITAQISKKAFREFDIEAGKTVWVSFKASACRFIEKI